MYVLGSIRSGSTLLRRVLGSHSLIHAPHELHLVDLAVSLGSPFSRLAMEIAKLDERELEHLLWDRVLHRALVRSGKRVIVDKTPTNLLRWRRVAECWPRARYIFLIRHPVQVIESAITVRPHATESTELVELFLTQLEEARGALSGITVTYEDLTGEPDRTTRELCGYLGLEWEPSMVEYGRVDHGGLVTSASL